MYFRKLIVLIFCISVFFNNSGFTQLPQVYDLRMLGLLTPVKDQGSCGSCWAFATISAIESNWLKNGYGYNNLSEDNIIDCHLFDETPCYGGSYYMANALFSRHEGPLNTIDDVYTPGVTDCPNSLPFPPQLPAFTEEFYLLPPIIDTIKNALLKYGAIATTMFFNSAYNPLNFKYYDSNIDSVDSLYAHCVCIAGWNDTMTFPGAPGNGGWIIKDSYGTLWAQSGYFYVSYYDAGILSETAVFPTRHQIPLSQNNSHVYYNDTYGWVDNKGFASNTASVLVKYIVSPEGGIIVPQQIKRIGTYAVEEDTRIKISIYRSFSGAVLSDLIDSQSIICPYKGFYTIPFNLKSDTLGATVYIEAEYKAITGVLNPIPVEIYEAGHTSGITLATNCTWISPDGSTWLQAGQGTPYTFDPCIKMYTEDAPYAEFTSSHDSVCPGGVVHFNDITQMPKDSIKWLVNDSLYGNMPAIDVSFSSVGQQSIKLVAFLGDNTDTAESVVVVTPEPVKPTVIQIWDSLVTQSFYDAYQWYDESGPIWGETEYFISLGMVNGWFYVEVINQYGCAKVSDSAYYAGINIVGENYKNEVLKVYPNPFQECINYRSSSLSPVISIKILNITGQLVYNVNCHYQQISKIELEQLPDGIYFIEFYFKNGDKQTAKVIKNKL